MSSVRQTDEEWVTDEVENLATNTVENELEFFHTHVSAIELRDSDYEIAAFHDLCYGDGKGKNKRIMGVYWQDLNKKF